MAELRIGTSGFAYRHWRGLFYPADLPARRWLARYAAEFDACELNATFYRLPTAAAVDGWRAETPAGFAFAVKGSRYLTHMKALRDPAPGIARFFGVVSRLGPRLGPVLWQLPARLRPDAGRLDAFLAALPRGLRHAVELRSTDWYAEEICDVLDAHGAAFCEHDLVRRAPPRLTGGWRYLRFHGATGRYRGRYGARALAAAARDLLAWRDAGHDAWAFFNNDVGGHAILDARALRSLVGADARAGAPA